MKILKISSLLILLIFNKRFLNSEEIKHYYFDINNNSLKQYDFIYGELKKYFDDNVPQKIIIKNYDGNTCRFEFRNNTVFINDYARKNDSIRTVAHESCHLCLAHLTKNASVKEKFRFFDEGFANIFGNMIANKLDDYKKESRNIASIQNNKNNVSFEKIENWSEYFGNHDKKTNFYAYPVGSSFDFYVIDTYGMDKLFSFFKDIGNTLDLENTFKNIFNKNKMEIENEWKQYLAKNIISAIPPKIVKMFPENGVTNVSTKIKEIYVEFDKPMAGNIFFITHTCNDGVCYKNAYWKSNKILSVKVGLLENYKYEIFLGDTIHGRFVSNDGIELPSTSWTFTTGKDFE